jgi:hypothetical protein
MAARIVYRYDNNKYEVGEIITPKRDSFGMLTDTEKQAETLIPSTLPCRMDRAFDASGAGARLRTSAIAKCTTAIRAQFLFSICHPPAPRL